MSGSEHSGVGGDEQRQGEVVSPTRVSGLRSASPAKRSAADMEDGPKHVSDGIVKVTEVGPTDLDDAMADMTSTDDTQDTFVDDTSTSAQASMSTDTYATSFQTEGPPSFSDSDPSRKRSSTDYSTEEIDAQEREVRRLALQPLDEGQKGIVVSATWLSRVLSRSTEGQQNKDYPKEAREGEIGPVDNADIVPEGAFEPPFLHDTNGRNYVPLKSGLSYRDDFEIFSDKAWGVIVGAYGIKKGQHQIDRYVQNTAPPEASMPNLQYDCYPPTFKIRKVPQADQNQDSSQSSIDPLQTIRLKKEQQARGQDSPNDALFLVSSRSERFQKFLARSKEAAGISRTTKVKVWRLLDVSKDTVNGLGNSQVGQLTPPTSPTRPSIGRPEQKERLVLELSAFKEMEIGKEIEAVDTKDETCNSNYNGNSTMETFGLFQDQTLLLEEQIGGPGGGEFVSDSAKKTRLKRLNVGSKPPSTTPSGRTSPAPGGGIMTRGRQRRDGRTRGTVGLQNLGNTCYMNSALQCIRSVEELAVYFMSDRYKQDINSNNPLGYSGVMAKQYAGVLQGIYGDSAGGSCSPSSFKSALSRSQPLFSGYGQQDSQEFLSFLVDALHEDLNRVLKKPYTENPDSDDSKVHDEEYILQLGETYRSNHHARNDSVAMDLFNGFYKNTMECPHCGKISITFDPYSLVTLQLPIENTLQHAITFIPLHGNPVNHDIDMDKNTTFKAVKEYIASKYHDVDSNRLWMIEVYSHKIFRIFEDTTTLAEANIQPADLLFIFELDQVPTNALTPSEKRLFHSSYPSNRDSGTPDMDDAKADRFAVPVFSRQKNRYGTGWDTVMHPVYITVTRDEAKDYDTVLKKVLIALSRLTSRPILTESENSSTIGPVTQPETETDERLTEENAQVSDRSVPSEDGYVEVSKRSPADGDPVGMATDDAAESERPAKDRSAPAGFMDPQFFLSPTLRNQLFSMNYAPSESGIHCASTAGFPDRLVRNVLDRVKQPSRRSSVNSSSSSQADSATSTGSAPLGIVESDESDADALDSDKPDITLGHESYLSIPTPIDEDPPSDNELLPDLAMSRKENRRQERGRKGRRGKQRTFSRRERNQLRQNQLNGTPSPIQPRQFGAKTIDVQNDNPYYIRLGEGIVLDWYPEAYKSLFGGDAKDQDDERGHFLSSTEAKGLPIASDPELEARKKRRQQRALKGITLDDCFQETGKREVLSEDNAWYCNRCKELRRATKTLEIWTIPDILVVHLKRFGGNRSFRDKLDAKVDFPIEGLDMTQRVGMKEDGKEYIYDLFAVDLHFGGLGGGHYTAYAKNFYDRQWYDYNDSSCSKIGEIPHQTAAAYLLFYRRRSDNPLGPQYLQDLVNESRNPAPQPSDATTDENAEESDSGEGRLGGPNGSLHGSPSALIGVGAAAVAKPGLGRLGGGAGVELLAGSNPMTRGQVMKQASDGDEEAEQPVSYGPHRPSDLPEYGVQGSSSWSFAPIDDGPARPDVVMRNAEDTIADYDADSTIAEADDNRMDDEWIESDFRDASGSNIDNTPATSPHDLPADSPLDNHAMYSRAHDDEDALHLEDAGMHGLEDEDDDEDLPTVSIDLDPPTPEREKMD